MPDPIEDASGGIDAAHFRTVLGHFPTGVTVITAMGDDGPAGLAVGSFFSVSLDPPLVGFCPNKASSSWPAIRDNLLAKQGPLSGGTFRAQLLDLAVGTEFIVAIVHATAERADYRLDQTVCQLMRVHNGKIVEVRGHYADEAALNAFWGPAPDVE